MIGLQWYIHHIIGSSHILIFTLLDKDFIQLYNIHNLLCYFHMIYYLSDTIHQLAYEKNIGYIIHHLFTFYQINTIRNVENIEAQIICNNCFGLLEFNSLILLVRSDLKETKKLTTEIDIIMYLSYFITRAIMFPYYIYIMSEYTPIYIPSGIYLMSMKWLYDWTIKLNKRIKSGQLKKID